MCLEVTSVANEASFTRFINLKNSQSGFVLTQEKPEPWERALTILGKSKGARLLALGMYMMATFGTPFFILNQFGVYEPVLALFFAFGLLFLVVGFGMYYDDWEKKSGKPRKAKSRKAKSGKMSGSHAKRGDELPS